MILIGVFLPLTLFLQGVLMLSPTGTGTLITALSISLTLGAALAGVSISQRKRYQLTAIAGAALMTAGVLLLLLMGATGNLTLIGLALVMVGLGTGSFFTIQMVVAQNAIPLSQLGVGIGVIRYLSQLGMTLGSALMGLIVNGALTGNTAASLSTTSTARIQLSGILQHGFGLVLVLSILILATTFFLKDVPHQQQAE
jgi:MFS family permease